ncbi:MAG: chemotaxis response regulator protein-glutamate methylesterase [Verrucomicrobiia bacterium]
MTVGIVNDMALAVEALRRVIVASGQHQVLWIARDGAEAVQKCAAQRPDCILMDLIMPVMDGVEATRQIMLHSPCAILVVTATVEGNAAKVFEAMGYGALDAVNTPRLGNSGSISGGEGLLAKMATISRLISPIPQRSPSTPLPAPAPSAPGRPLILIGSSTGGPQALAEILSALGPGSAVPIVLVQHVDVEFAVGLANWLATETGLRVRVACSGDTPEPGHVHLAGTTDHLVIRPDGRFSYQPEPKDAFYRPSVDVLFESAARHWNGPMLAVLLTGMGRDGARGLLALKQAGADTIAQDKDSCIVFGMPKAAIELGAARHVLPLHEIGPALRSFAAPSTSPA